MRGPLSQKATVRKLAAPLRGWNSRDPLAMMKPTDAVILDNWIADTVGLRLRNGATEHAPALSAAIETLVPYARADGADALFAAAGDGIYDATVRGLPPPKVVDGLTKARFESETFSNSAGTFLFMVNGQDPAKRFDGATWSEPAITGVSSAVFASVKAHARRLWFIEKDSLRVWYLDTNAVQGAAKSLDLGPLATLGGHLIAMASWTRDGGVGADDLALFITSKGQVFAYAGTDPDTIGTFQLVGTFQIGEPVSPRTIVKYGADVGIVTSQGVIAMSTVLPSTGSESRRNALTGRIDGAFQFAYQAGAGLFGWQAIEFARLALLVVNVPQREGFAEQFVLNVMTGAWCRFRGLNALCWAQANGRAFFGTPDGRVCEYGVGYEDFGEPIVGDVMPSFQDFGTVAEKQFVMARPLYSAAEGSAPALDVRLDYDLSDIPVASADVPGAGAKWGKAKWGKAKWGPSMRSSSVWQSVVGIGQVASVRLKVSSRNPFMLSQIDLAYQPGGVF